MTRMIRLAAVAGLWAGTALAEDSGDMAALLDALRIEGAVEIMRAEGLDYGADVGAEMVPGVSQAAWAARVAEVYNSDRMARQVSDGLRDALAPEHVGPVLTFLQSETGQDIIALEISAREAFLDPATEEAAFASYEEAKRAETPLYQQVQGLIDDSSLVDFNVMGALNSNLMFYRGLDEGGAIEMPESEMLSDVWAQEEAVRDDSAAWLGAFLMMAYRPLEPEALEAYAAFYRSEPGRALNAAIFRAYDGMYEQVSYLLGLAVAQQMTSEEL